MKTVKLHPSEASAQVAWHTHRANVGLTSHFHFSLVTPMAIRRIECPHCQENVELDVTSVTRSRDCPKCGKPIILQFTSTEKRSKRTALMVPAASPMDKLSEAQHGVHEGPRTLEGDVYERMAHDPEVRRAQRRLIIGAGVVAGLIAILSVAHWMNWWSVLQGSTEKPLPPVAAPSESNSGTPAASSSPSAPKASDSDVASTTIPTPPAPEPVPKPSEPPAPTAVPTLPPNPPPTAAQPAPAPAPSIPAAAASASVAPVVVTTVPALIEEERALKSAGAFLNAKNVDERLQHVRDRDAMEKVMRAYYATHPDGPIPFKLITTESGSPLNQLQRKFEVQFPDGNKRRLLVGRTKLGDYRADWASFVIYSEMEWDDFITKRPTNPVFMRVFAQTDSRYDGAFADAKRFLCVKLTNPLNAESPPIHAYALRHTSAGQALDLVLRTSAGEREPFMLTLQHPPPVEGATAAGNQVVIERLIDKGWVTTGR
jgi:hypothetical protein